MNKFSRRLELLANILIILVAPFLSTVLVRQHSFDSQTPFQRTGQGPIVGSTLDNIAIDFSAKPKTVILALNKRCSFCAESAPFYNRLLKISRNSNLRLIAVLTGNVKESREYLNELGLEEIDVMQMPLKNINVKDTPTLIMVNSEGLVIDFWVGRAVI